MTSVAQAFKILYVSSIDPDLSPRARIRIAALSLFGRHGVARATVRQIAAEAGVSPGLVIHYFGSKDGLREAVDEWIVARLAADKRLLVSMGALPDLSTYSDDAEFAAIVAYNVARLREGGAAAERIFELMCQVADDSFEVGIQNGYMNRPSDREATVALLVAFTAGMSMLADVVARRLGGESYLDPDTFRRISLATLEFYTEGIITDRTILESARAQADAPPPAPTRPSHEGSPPSGAHSPRRRTPRPQE